MHFSQRLKVCWDNAALDIFECSNGVRQGSSLSPFLYSAYIDGVLNEIAETNIGYKIAGRVWNCLAYADDIVLFALSWRGSQLLMNKLFDLMANTDMAINCKQIVYDFLTSF